MGIGEVIDTLLSRVFGAFLDSVDAPFELLNAQRLALSAIWVFSERQQLLNVGVGRAFLRVLVWIDDLVGQGKQLFDSWLVLLSHSHKGTQKDSARKKFFPDVIAKVMVFDFPLPQRPPEDLPECVGVNGTTRVDQGQKNKFVVEGAITALNPLAKISDWF